MQSGRGKTSREYIRPGTSIWSEKKMNEDGYVTLYPQNSILVTSKEFISGGPYIICSPSLSSSLTIICVRFTPITPHVHDSRVVAILENPTSTPIRLYEGDIFSSITFTYSGVPLSVSKKGEEKRVRELSEKSHKWRLSSFISSLEGKRQINRDKSVKGGEDTHAGRGKDKHVVERSARHDDRRREHTSSRPSQDRNIKRQEKTSVRRSEDVDRDSGRRRENRSSQRMDDDLERQEDRDSEEEEDSGRGERTLDTAVSADRDSRRGERTLVRGKRVSLFSADRGDEEEKYSYMQHPSSGSSSSSSSAPSSSSSLVISSREESGQHSTIYVPSTETEVIHHEEKEEKDNKHELQFPELEPQPDSPHSFDDHQEENEGISYDDVPTLAAILFGDVCISPRGRKR